MKISILTDNSAAPRFLATHGFSCYIEADINVLFDFGPDNTFLINSQRLKIDLNPHYLVLSHGHWDHADGIEYVESSTLICHPGCFEKRYSKVKDAYVGIKYTEEQLANKHKIIKTREPLQLSRKIWFLGEIPKTNNFEAQHSDFCNEQKKDDFIPDDSALAVETDKGLVIITGCAHSGICNIDYAIKITGIDKIHTVLGGFHLKSPGESTQKTIQFLLNKQIKEIHPAHCTSLPALTEFYKAFKQAQVLAGHYFTF